jgi:excisionase family DNA binding protein
MSTAQSPRFLKIGEAAKLLGLSSETLRRWERDGKITFSRTPGGKRLFSEADLEQIKNLLKPTHQPVNALVDQPTAGVPSKSFNFSLKIPSIKLPSFKFPTIKLPRIKIRFVYFKSFVFLMLVAGNIVFFSQTPYAKILSDNIKIASERVETESRILAKEIEPHVIAANSFINENYKKLSQNVSENYKKLSQSTSENYKKLSQNVSTFKKKSEETTSKVVVKAKEVVLSEEVAPAADILLAGLYGTTPLYSPTNLIINSSFEAGIGNYSIIGQSTNANTKVVNESIRTGTLALKIRDDFCIGCHLGVSQPKVNTINGRTYAFSMYVRVKDLVGSPKIRIGLFGEVSKSDPLYLSQPPNYSTYAQDRYEDHYLENLRDNEWVRISSSFDNLPLGKYPIILIYDYQGGTIYVDDLSLNEGVNDGELVLSAQTGFNFPIEENNIKLGSNTIITDAFGNLTTPGKITAGAINLTGTFTNTGHGVFNTLTVTGNINSDDGALQTNGVTRIDNSGNLTAGTGSFSGNVTPALDASYDLGSEAVRWRNAYFSGDVTAGDLVFKNDFRFTEDGNFGMFILNPQGEKIGGFDRYGNFWMKGEIKQWSGN